MCVPIFPTGCIWYFLLQKCWSYPSAQLECEGKKLCTPQISSLCDLPFSHNLLRHHHLLRHRPNIASSISIASSPLPSSISPISMTSTRPLLLGWFTASNQTLILVLNHLSSPSKLDYIHPIFGSHIRHPPTTLLGLQAQNHTTTRWVRRALSSRRITDNYNCWSLLQDIFPSWNMVLLSSVAPSFVLE